MAGIALLTTACSENSPTAPANLRITRVSGNLQQAVVRSYFAQPLTVLLTTTAGRPVADQRVDFVLADGDGRLTVESALTDQMGMASTRVRAGSAVGEVHILASAFGGEGKVEFSLTVTAAPTPQAGELTASIDFAFDDGLQGWEYSEGPGSFVAQDGVLYHQGPKWCTYYYPVDVPPDAEYELDVHVVPGVYGTSLIVGLQMGFEGHDLSFRSTDRLGGSLFVTFNTTPLVSDSRDLRVEYIDGGTRRVLYQGPTPFGESHLQLRVELSAVRLRVNGEVLIDETFEFLQIRAGRMVLKSGDGGSGDWFDNVAVTPVSSTGTSSPLPDGGDSPGQALLTTANAGDLVFELVSTEGLGDVEFGLGTPSRTSARGERDAIFELTLNLSSYDVSPSRTVSKGLHPAGSELHFYGRSVFGGREYWAFSSHLGGNPSSSDRVMFLDSDGSLGRGGSVVETLDTDHWRLHLDDAASVCCDDDDNDLVVDVRVIQE